MIVINSLSSSWFEFENEDLRICSTSVPGLLVDDQSRKGAESSVTVAAGEGPIIGRISGFRTLPVLLKSGYVV